MFESQEVAQEDESLVTIIIPTTNTDEINQGGNEL